ncbi:uncharacterized protein [Littorina saxatilis]|uniref:uncharacterized protein n=1 Tax=Littorina saxatilis TaxID=31220 RepID=UPI0038B546E8
MAVDVAPRPHWQVFPPPRLPVFTSGDDGCHLDHFTTEARRVISHFNMAALGGEGAEWLIQSLAGAARKEVNLHPPQATATADLVLTILQDTFGDHASSSSLLSSFFTRYQGQEEGLLSYAHSLQSLHVKINSVVPDTLTDDALRDHFIDGLFLHPLRRDLLRFVRGREAVTFAAVRAEALRWMREDVDVVADQATPVSKERSAGLSRLQVPVNELAVSSAELRAALDQHPRAAPRQQQPSAKPRCWLCNRHGHLQSRCPTKRHGSQQPLSWRQPSELRVDQQSTSIKQPPREQSSQTEEVVTAQEQLTSKHEASIDRLETRLKKELEAKQQLQDERFQKDLEIRQLRERLVFKCEEVSIERKAAGHIRKDLEALLQQQLTEKEHRLATAPAPVEPHDADPITLWDSVLNLSCPFTLSPS